MRLNQAMRSTHVYEVRPRKDHRAVDLIFDAVPFSRLWYGEPNAVSNAVGSPVGVVSDVPWIAKTMGLIVPLLHHEVRFFGNAEADAARKWLEPS
jgi:SpoIIAA-like